MGAANPWAKTATPTPSCGFGPETATLSQTCANLVKCKTKTVKPRTSKAALKMVSKSPTKSSTRIVSKVLFYRGGK